MYASFHSVCMKSIIYDLHVLHVRTVLQSIVPRVHNMRVSNVCALHQMYMLYSESNMTSYLKRVINLAITLLLPALDWSVTKQEVTLLSEYIWIMQAKWYYIRYSLMDSWLLLVLTFPRISHGVGVVPRHLKEHEHGYVEASNGHVARRLEGHPFVCVPRDFLQTVPSHTGWPGRRQRVKVRDTVFSIVRRL